MTARGRKRHAERLRAVLAESIEDLSDESEDERRDFSQPDRNLFESEHGPEMGDDGDDNPEYAQPKPAFTTSGKSVKVKLKNGKASKVEAIEPGQIHETIVIPPKGNPAGEIVDAGHGFLVDNPRSRPWKTAPRTHCAYCAGPMPAPDVSGYRCELEPDASEAELSLVGEVENQRPDLPWAGSRSTGMWRGCQCSGCGLRWLVLNGHERNRGQPPMCCSANCKRNRDNERNAWKRAVKRAEKAGLPAPDEPEDRGLKLMVRSGPRSGFEGNGSRYTAATGHRWELPPA